jgi:DNA anti-recombination protein RmuC
MFMPAEVFLNAAMDVDPALLEYAFENNVVIATPQTLMALLRTVAYTWRQEALARNAQDVLRLGRDLHGRLSTLGSHVNRLGSALTSAVKNFNSTVSSLESRVLVTARRFADLKVADEELEAPAQRPNIGRSRSSACPWRSPPGSWSERSETCSPSSRSSAGSPACSRDGCRRGCATSAPLPCATTRRTAPT